MRDILIAAFETICFYAGKSSIYALSLGHCNPDWRDGAANRVEACGLAAIAIAGTIALFT